jgi:NADP-dependent 3-hydroxy acid dehydrogenase YdfG
MTWNDTVVIVTGASAGIGASCARLLKRKVALLALTGFPDPEFQEADWRGTLITLMDFTTVETHARVVEETMRHFGPVDVLINSAGVSQYAWPSEVGVNISKRMFDVNVFAALALTRLVLPIMRRQDSGAIVNIGCVGGKVSPPWAVMYPATTWAQHCIDDSLRRELRGSGVSVTKVCPGIVATTFHGHVLAGQAPEFVRAIRRIVQPDDIARGVVRGIERRQRTVYISKHRLGICDSGHVRAGSHGSLPSCESRCGGPIADARVGEFVAASPRSDTVGGNQ